MEEISEIVSNRNKKKNSKEKEFCRIMDDVRVTSPSSSESSSKNRSDSGCSTFEEKANSGNSTDSGHGSTEAEESVVFSYHFLIPAHLCGRLIGAQGANIEQFRRATKCTITLIGDKSSKTESQVCVIEGKRSGIERCLELIQEKLPPHECPELSLKQINEPTQNDLQTQAAASNGGLVVTLPPGTMSTAIVTAIVTAGHVFIQLPENPTFMHLQRLENCMQNLYERHNAPGVPREKIAPGLVCVGKMEDEKYYRLQVVSFDNSEERCEVKFLDYGGYDKVDVGQLRQIRQDLMSLPFQAVECYLSNVIPPFSCTEWPFESMVHLEELTRGKSLSCREIGVSEESVPVVQLYITSYNESKSELETRFVNKELVERGAAQWVEHSTL